MPSIFEDFSLGPQPGSQTGQSAEAALESFDEGYKAGWNDAAQAHSESQSHVSSVLSRNIEAMEFTLAEARAMVLDMLKPVLDEIGQTLLPSIAANALQASFMAELAALLQSALPDRIRFDLSTADAPAIEALLEAEGPSDKVDLNIRDALGEGQIYIALGNGTRRIDIPQAIQGIADALSAFDPMATHQELEQIHAG